MITDIAINAVETLFNIEIPLCRIEMIIEIVPG